MSGNNVQYWSSLNPPAWAGAQGKLNRKPSYEDFGWTTPKSTKADYFSALNRYRLTDGYGGFHNYHPPKPVDPQEPTDPVDPVDPENPADANTINVRGSRQANGEQNIFTFTNRNESAKTLNIEANSGAIFNNLFAPVNANLNGPFAGYIGGRENGNSAGVNLTGSGGGVNAIVHSFTEFQDPVNNTAGTAPVNINLANSANSRPNRIIAIGGEGNISGVDFLTVMSSREGNNGNGGFNIRGAREVRIVATNIQRTGTQGNTQIWQDERGSEYRIEGLNTRVTASGTRDRSAAGSTFDDVPGQSPGYGIRQNGALPHNTAVITPTGERIDLAQISPTDRPIEATAQNDQTTPSAGLGTASRAPQFI